MPVGKNSLKRVTNSGYSNVKTEAPDMENSTVTVAPKEEPTKDAAKKTTAKKPAPQEKKSTTSASVAKKSTTSKAQALNKPAPEASPAIEKKIGTEPKKYAVGDKMPIYLL